MIPEKGRITVMDYPVRILSVREELNGCPIFTIRTFQWRSVKKPYTWGQMGWLAREGLYVRMVCQEAWPKRTVTEPQTRVDMDSAMSLFLTFGDRESPYIHLEFNGNGAMTADYGRGEAHRTPALPEEYRRTGVRALVSPDYWQVDLTVPLSLLRRLYGLERLHAGDSFLFNAHKSSRDPAIQHYGSCWPMDSPTPNFHLPGCFGRGALV